eukprot:7038195-Pyramimonas_sp.AAC.1
MPSLTLSLGTRRASLLAGIAWMAPRTCSPGKKLKTPSEPSKLDFERLAVQAAAVPEAKGKARAKAAA